MNRPARAGRDPEDLSREFEPSGQAIRNWVAAADRRDGRREPKPAVVAPALAANERDELLRLRRENKQLRLQRDILSRAAAWFARETGVVPSGCTSCDRPRRPARKLTPWSFGEWTGNKVA